MCGRYYRRSEKQEIAERFRLSKLPEDTPLPPDFNIAPTTFQPVIRQDRDAGEREMVIMRWGMVPYFAESLAKWKGLSTVNARAENIMSSGTWRAPLERRRCLVPADGFYEWKQPASSKDKKQPFAFTLTNGEPMAFAGLWDAWREPKSSPQATDTWLQSFAIITTEANELMSTVHTRMPVILHQRDWARWLDRSLIEQPPIDLLRPYESEAMKAEACNPAVGNVKNNGPEMLNSA